MSRRPLRPGSPSSWRRCSTFGTNTGGGFVDQHGREYLIRNVGLTKRLDDLRNTVVTYRAGQPVLLRQVAEVAFAPAVKRGDAGYNGRSAVIVSIQKQPGADTVDLTRRIEATLASIQKTLPAGVKADNIQFRQATFIETSIGNIRQVLLEAAAVVAVVERAAGSDVLVQEARERSLRTMSLDAFLAERVADFAAGGTLVDQPFQARHLEGMIRCYVSGTRVAGFGAQYVTALAPPEHGRAPPRLYSGPDDERFQRLRRQLEADWIPRMTDLLGLAPDDLPVVWDADFLLGAKDAAGEDTYVLCEINASSVYSIPDEAHDALAATTLRRLADARARWTARRA